MDHFYINIQQHKLVFANCNVILKLEMINFKGERPYFKNCKVNKKRPT